MQGKTLFFCSFQRWYRGDSDRKSFWFSCCTSHHCHCYRHQVWQQQLNHGVFSYQQLRGICLKHFEIRANLGVPSFPTRSRKKSRGTPWTFDYHKKIGIILRCNPWVVGCLPEGTFWGFCMEKIGQNPKIGQIWRPEAPKPYVAETSWPDLWSCLALGLQRG